MGTSSYAAELLRTVEDIAVTHPDTTYYLVHNVDDDPPLVSTLANVIHMASTFVECGRLYLFAQADFLSAPIEYSAERGTRD